MIDHVIIFRPNEDMTPEGEQALFAKFETLRHLPGVVGFALGKNFGARSRGFDICMRVTLVDRAALDAYEASATHLEVVAYNRQVTQEHLCVDFEWTNHDG